VRGATAEPLLALCRLIAAGAQSLRRCRARARYARRRCRARQRPRLEAELRAIERLLKK